MRTPLWTPTPQRVAGANMTRFQCVVNERYGLSLDGWEALRIWSVEHLQDFWAVFWDFAGIRASHPYTEVVDDPKKLPGARWFSGARLNFAQNLLRRRGVGAALVSYGEDGAIRRWSWDALVSAVSRLSRALARGGVGAGDRVGAYMPNIGETVIAMLAATSLGATWTTASPELGVDGVVDRFGQTRPRVLIATDGFRHDGVGHDIRGRLRDLMDRLPSVERMVVVPFLDKDPSFEGIRDAVRWDRFLEPASDQDIDFVQVPAEQPLYIMYSSGASGLPRCIIQSTGGVLLHHLKELVLHTDLKPDDVIFFYTTCGQMMWNWLVSSLGAGATVVLYDGSPVFPSPNVLWRIVQDEAVTHFGASARFHDTVRGEGMRPGEYFQLHHLRTVLSTGSPLVPESFEYIYRHVKSDLHLASISGGTELNGFLALGNPLLPVYSGEIQCRPLAMGVDAFDVNGNSVADEKGELVCTTAFPSMPLGFCNDDDLLERAAYFERYPGIWHHGDFVEILSDTGGLVIHGRSDATLNPGGVRIGTADIYRVVETLPEVVDSLCVGQRWEGDERIILFLKLDGDLRLTDNLRDRVRGAIRTRLTSRHLPLKVIQVADIPYTMSMKKVEIAVRQLIHGEVVENRDALFNPEALELYVELEELKS
ncbi:MAG: acetoacetate--CoA ligase [Pseudomonadota bacterium]